MASYHAHCMNGVFCYDRIVIVDGRLDRMPYAQAGFIETKDATNALISYDSLIFEVDGDGNISFEHSQACPDYSRTTAKHVGAFCKQFCPQYTYHDIKRMYYEKRK